MYVTPSSHRPTPAVLAPHTVRLARSIGGQHKRSFATSADLSAEALLAAVECSHRFDAGRGPALTSYAFARMRGRALDALRREARHHRTCQALRAESGPCPSEAPRATVTARIDVGRAVAKVQPWLRTTERLVLDQVYGQDATLVELAQEGRWSESQLQRAHASLLRRLRATMAGESLEAKN